MTVRLAMHYTEVEQASLIDFIEDDAWALEQKVDGTRCLILIKTEKEGQPFVRFLGREGRGLSHTAAMQHFAKIEEALKPHFTKCGEAVIDGEIMIDTGQFIAFDLPYLEVEGNMLVLPTDTYRDRAQSLSFLMGTWSGPVRRIYTARDFPSKTLLAEKVMAQGGEGLMAKRLDSMYEPGARVKHSVKLKFVKTADVVVMDVTRGRNEAGREVGSITFGIWQPEHGEVRTLGSCSVIGKPHVEPGNVIEVRYLYRPPGGSLVQPSMIRVREDKEPKDCTIDQFPVYSKAVL